MILYSMLNLEIGKIYSSESPGRVLSVKGKKIKNFRFMVMKNVSKKEYDTYYLETYGKLYSSPPPKNANYYEVSTD